MTDSPQFLVVGGGIAGLAAAYRLCLRDDHPTVTVIETSDRLGGKLRTDRVDGFVVDSGPEAIAPGRPNAANLAAELGVTLVEAAPGAPGAVLVKGRIRPMPEGLGGFMPRKFAPLATSRLVSPAAKLRMATEPIRPARTDPSDESVESFATRRLGKQAYARLIEPVASGIFCGDPAQMSILATLPFLRAAEAQHGGLVKAVLAERKAARTKPAPPRRPGLMAPSTGMEALIDALVDHIGAAGAEILKNTRVVSLRRSGERYIVTLAVASETDRKMSVDGVIIATPTHAAADILDSVGAAEAAATLNAMANGSTTTVSLGYVAARLPDLDHLLPAHGYLIAEPGRGPVRSVTRSSSKYADRAPVGHELFRVIVRTDDAASNEELVRLAREELERTLGIKAEPVLEHVQRWSGVMPQYAVGHLDRVAELDQQLADFPGIKVAGSGVHGLGIPDCVFSGERAAGTLVPAAS